MAKYRVIKLESTGECYHLQRKDFWRNKWRTIDTSSYEDSILIRFSRCTGVDFPNQKVIVESK